MDKVLRLGIDPTAAEEGARRYRQATNDASEAADRLRIARERNATAAGNEGAAARVAADTAKASARYELELANVKIGVVKGTLDTAAATEYARIAQEKYNETLLRLLSTNKAQLNASSEGRQTFTQTAMLLEAQGEGANRAGVGTSRLAREMVTLTDRMVGFNPVAGQGLYILTQMGTGGGGALLGAVAGLTLLAGAYALATKDAREQKKAVDDLVDSLHNQAVARATVGTSPTENDASLRSRLSDLRKQLAQGEQDLAKYGTPDTSQEVSVIQAYYAVREVITRRGYDRLKLSVTELEQQLADIQERAMQGLAQRIASSASTDAIEKARSAALRANFSAGTGEIGSGDPAVAQARADAATKIGIQFDLESKLAKNAADAEAQLLEHYKDMTPALHALIDAQHQQADATARQQAADARAQLALEDKRKEMERILAIWRAIASVSGARDVSGMVAPLGGGTINQFGQYTPPSVAGRDGSTYHENTIRNPNSLTGGFYAPNSLTPITVPGTGHIRFAGDGITGTSVAGGDFRPDTFPEWLRGANSDISNSWVGKNAGKAAGIANLALGLGGAGFQNSEVGMGVSGALQYGQMGAQVAGPLGAIVGAVGGFVKGIFDHEAKMKELQAAQQAFNESIEARQAAAAGDPQTAQRLELAIRQEKELDDARKAGMDKVSIAALAEVQAEERSAQAKEQAAKSAEFDLSIQARREAAIGNPEAAAAIQRQIDEEHELAQARADGMSASQIAALKAVQAEEDLATARQKTADITALEAQNADTVAKSLSGYASETYDKTHPDQANTPFIYSSVYRQLTEEYGKIISNPFMTQDDRDKAKALYLQQLAYAQQQYETQQAINANAQQATLMQQQLQTDQQQLSIAQQALNAQQQTVDTLQRVYDSLDQFSKSLLVGSQSPLSPYDQLKEAGKQFFALSGSARGGDQSAAGQLQGSGQQYLAALRGYYGSSTGYQTGFNAVQAEINAVKDKFGQQITDAQRQLDQLQQQTSLAQQAVDNDQKQLAILKQQADALNGIGNATADAASTLHRYDGPLVNTETDAAASAGSLRLIELNTGGSMTALQALQTYSYNSWQTQQDILFELRSMHSDLVGQLDDIRVAEQAAAVRN